MLPFDLCSIESAAHINVPEHFPTVRHPNFTSPKQCAHWDFIDKKFLGFLMSRRRPFLQIVCIKPVHCSRPSKAAHVNLVAKEAECLDVQDISGEEASTFKGHGRFAEARAARCAHEDLTFVSRFQFDVRIQVDVAPDRQVGEWHSGKVALWAECAGSLRTFSAEVEGVRQEVREVKRESKARRTAHMNMTMWMG